MTQRSEPLTIKFLLLDALLGLHLALDELRLHFILHLRVEVRSMT